MVNQWNQQYARCECHECTQARWRMFGGGGLSQLQVWSGATGQAFTGQNLPNQELQPNAFNTKRAKD